MAAFNVCVTADSNEKMELRCAVYGFDDSGVHTIEEGEALNDGDSIIALPIPPVQEYNVIIGPADDGGHINEEKSHKYSFSTFTPELSIARIGGWNSLGLAAYGVFLLLPTVLHIKEAIQWHISRSRI